MNRFRAAATKYPTVIADQVRINIRIEPIADDSKRGVKQGGSEKLIATL